MKPRIGFVTCVELGRSCIEEVLALGGEFDLLITLEDERARDKSGRVYLDDLANQTGTPLVKVRHINDTDTIEAIRAARLDWLFIIGWSQIAGEQVLSSVRRGVLGMHPTLLPKGRGRAAIPWAILKGLRQTGVTLFALDTGVDSGPIADQLVIDVGERETAGSLYSRVADAHRELMRRNWLKLMSGSITLSQQNEAEATYWPGRKPEDGEIVPEMSVAEVDRLVRATTRPYPGAFIKEKGGVYTIWAGIDSSCAEANGGLQVGCRDGVFVATDFEIRK